jgi:hypothetical protein
MRRIPRGPTPTEGSRPLAHHARMVAGVTAAWTAASATLSRVPRCRSNATTNVPLCLHVINWSAGGPSAAAAHRVAAARPITRAARRCHPTRGAPAPAMAQEYQRGRRGFGRRCVRRLTLAPAPDWLDVWPGILSMSRMARSADSVATYSRTDFGPTPRSAGGYRAVLASVRERIACGPEASLRSPHSRSSGRAWPKRLRMDI